MAKTKIRLSESQLISLIQKSIKNQSSLLNEQATLSQISQATRDLKYNLTGDVQVVDLEKSQTVLNDRVFGKLAPDGKTCALKKVIDYYPTFSLSFGELSQTLAYGSEYSDFIEAISKSKEAGQPEFEDIKKELLDSINTELNGFCKTLGQAPAPAAGATPQQTQQTNKFSCAESEPSFRAYGTGLNQYAEVDWQGGKLSFYLDARPLGDGAPANDNVLYQKGGRKWTTRGDCSEGGPGKQRGLTLGTWTVKTN